MVKLFITRVYFRINCEDGERERTCAEMKCFEKIILNDN